MLLLSTPSDLPPSAGPTGFTLLNVILATFLVCSTLCFMFPPIQRPQFFEDPLQRLHQVAWCRSLPILQRFQFLLHYAYKLSITTITNWLKWSRCLLLTTALKGICYCSQLRWTFDMQKLWLPFLSTLKVTLDLGWILSLIHISEPTRPTT